MLRFIPGLFSAHQVYSANHGAVSSGTDADTSSKQGPRISTATVLESIRIHLPVKDLFVVQRTCAQWQDITAKSNPLQKRMVLTPSGKVERPVARQDRHHHERIAYKKPTKLNPSIQFHTCHWEPMRGGRWDRTSKYVSFGISHFHGAPFDRVSVHSIFRLMNPGKYPGRVTGPRVAGAFRGDASWRKMFVTQPPVSALYGFMRFRYLDELHEIQAAAFSVYKCAGYSF